MNFSVIDKLINRAPMVAAADSSALSLKVVRARVASVAELQEAETFKKNERADLAIIRCAPGALDLLPEFRDKNYLLADTLCYYAIPASKIKSDGNYGQSTRAGFFARPATTADADKILEIARKSFRDYPNHYYNNPDLRHRDWLEIYISSLRQILHHHTPFHHVIAACSPANDVVAFASIRVHGDQYTEGLLAGTDPDLKGDLAIPYRFAVREAIRFGLATYGAKYAFTATQIQNESIQRIWTKMGWYYTGSLYTFHSPLARPTGQTG
jgi:hypothetical protein